jgi:hypothetical protein
MMFAWGIVMVCVTIDHLRNVVISDKMCHGFLRNYGGLVSKYRLLYWYMMSSSPIFISSLASTAWSSRGWFVPRDRILYLLVCC